MTSNDPPSSEPASTDRNGGRPPTAPGLAAAAVVVGLGAIVARQMAQASSGRLAYEIDDAHIHLRVAQELAHGTYGINPGHAASASSSALWPLLLAPFGRFAWLDWVPLLIDLAAVGLTVVVVHQVLLRGWAPLPVADRSWFPWAAAAGAAWLTVATYALGIAFTGMEPSLVILATLALVLGLQVLEADPARRGPWWLWASLVALPLLRYEGVLTMILGAAIAFALGAGRSAVRSALAGLALLAAFSAFLVALGLPPIPSSVLAKGSIGPGHDLLHTVRTSLDQDLPGPVWLAAIVLVVASIAAIALVVTNRHRITRDLPTMLAGATVLILGIQFALQPGRRYVDYAVALAVTVGVGVVAPALRLRVRPWIWVPAWAVLAGVAVVGMATNLPLTLGAPDRARSINSQQYQMHRFAEQLGEPVAVNDLGQVSFDADVEVLDLWGLGDEDARRLRMDDQPGWMQELMEQRGVEVAMVYSWWFPDQIPGSWIRVGSFSNPIRGALAGQEVDIWATGPDAADRARRALEHFEPSDPSRTIVTVGTER